MWLYMFVKTNFPLYYSTLYDYIRLYPSSPHSIAIISPKKYVGPGRTPLDDMDLSPRDPWCTVKRWSSGAPYRRWFKHLVQEDHPIVFQKAI